MSTHFLYGSGYDHYVAYRNQALQGERVTFVLALVYNYKQISHVG